jgi:hypothetical protein
LDLGSAIAHRAEVLQPVTPEQIADLAYYRARLR